MSLFIDILLAVTGPIVVLIGAGWWLQPRLALDLASLNRLIVQVVLPAFFVHYLSTSDVPVAAAWGTAWFTALQFIDLTGLGWLVAKMLGLRCAVPIVVGLATALSNSGNFGIPLAELAFGADMILHQAVIVSAQSIFVFTLGPVLLLGGADGWRTGLQSLKSPIYAAIIIGLVLKAFDVTLPTLAATPFAMIGSLYTPLALFTLGAQLAASNGRYSRTSTSTAACTAAKRARMLGRKRVPKSSGAPSRTHPPTSGRTKRATALSFSFCLQFVAFLIAGEISEL